MVQKTPDRSPRNPFAPWDGPWQDRVAYASQGLIAYRPGELIAPTADDAEQAVEYLREVSDAEVASIPIFGEFVLLKGAVSFDVERAVLDLRERGARVEANVVFFSHGGGRGCGGCCGCCGGMAGNPFNSNPFNSNPFNSNPFNSNPFNSNPFNSNPFNSNPFNSNPFNSNPFNSNPFNSNPFNSNPFNSNPFNSNGWAATGERPSSARPADAPTSLFKLKKGKGRAIVLDTGIAKKSELPTMLAAKNEHIDAPAPDREEPDLDGDGFLDASSGHGTFIAGVIEQIAPGHVVRSARVLGNYGDGDAASIAFRLHELLPSVNEFTVLNMSFGSYGDPDLHLLSAAIEGVQEMGAVVVSSAGNDGTCLRSYPAALPDVVSVGSIDAGGRAHYSNFGDWVRACAPGTDVVSSFYKKFNGASPVIPGEGDPDDFAEWARWTGTSFAAPIVAAALIRHMALTGTTAQQAVAAVIDAPTLGRFPGLGTVVNLVPGM